MLKSLFILRHEQGDTPTDWPLQASELNPVDWALASLTVDPRDRLWALLDVWATLDESEWTEANVKALFEDILDVFRDYAEAECWFREWRTAHPEARLW